MTTRLQSGRAAGLVVKGLQSNKGNGVMPFSDVFNNVKAAAEAGKVREVIRAQTTLAS